MAKREREPRFVASEELRKANVVSDERGDYPEGATCLGDSGVGEELACIIGLG